MSNIFDNEQQIDPELIKKIELIKPTPDRDPQLVIQGRERFLSELEGLPVAGSRSPLTWLAGIFKLKSQKDNTLMGSRTQRAAFTAVMAIIIFMVMLFGGASVTAYASQSALPGDGLYAVKTRLELAQVALEADAYSEAQLHLQFAQRRMDEINELLLQGRGDDVDLATSEFEYHIQSAIEDLGNVLASDPELGAELSKKVSNALLDYAIRLKTVLLNSPELVKPAVENALLVSQDGAGEEHEIIGTVEFISETAVEIDGETYIISDLTEFEHVIKVGDMIKVHVIHTADGMKIVREIELFSSSDDDMDSDDDQGEDSEDEHIGDDDEDDHDLDEDDSESDDIDEDDGHHDDGDDDTGDSLDDDDSENGDGGEGGSDSGSEDESGGDETGSDDSSDDDEEDSSDDEGDDSDDEEDDD